MQDNTPRYIVSFSNGKVAKLTEQEYNDSKDQIYQFDRNASAARINDFSFDDDVDDSATYTVGLPNGKFSVFSAQQYRDSREELRKVEGIQIGSLSPVDYWGEKLNALNKQIAELEPKMKKASYDAFQNPDNNWDFTDEDLDVGAAVDAARRSVAAKSEMEGYEKRLTTLKQEREANPVYQAARQQRIQGLHDFTSDIDRQMRALDDANPESARVQAPMGGGMTASLQDMDFYHDYTKNPQYHDDMMALAAAKMWINDAEKAEKAPSRYDTTRSGFQNFLAGVTGNIKDLSTVLGLAEGLVKNLPLIGIIKQIQGKEGDDANIITLVENMQSDPNALPYLSEAQKTLVRAFVVKTLTDAELAGDTSLGYRAGQSAVASLGFMKDFILTGGEGSIAEVAAKGATKWMTKGIAKASLNLGLKGAGRAAAQALPKFAVGTVKGAVKTAIMTPFMPSSYKNLLDNLTQVNLQDGTVDLSGKAVLQAVGDVFIENFSENAGGQVEAILGVPFKALGTAADKVFANTAFSTWGKAVGNAQITKLLKQAGWNGFIGEIGEEWYGNTLRVMTGVDKDALKDFATVDQQIITLASFAPMSIFGLGASSGQYLAALKQMEGAGEKLSAILAKNNYSEDQIKAILAATKAENPTELAQLLSPVVNQIAADNGDASEAYKAVCDFAKAIAQYRTLDGLRDSDAEGERLQAAAAIDAELGADSPSFDENGNITGESKWMQRKVFGINTGENEAELGLLNSVRVLTDENGAEYFVKSESETDGYGLIERGTGRRVAATSLDGYTDSGVMSLNDFLDREIARKRRGADQVRMAQETLQNRAQIIQQAQLGTQLNLGTEENPVMGTIREIQPGDVFIIESERGTRPYSLQEVADFMRHPLNSLPAEEIDNQTAEMMNRISEKKNTLNQMLIDGTAGRVQYQGQSVFRVIGQDGNGNVRILMDDAPAGIEGHTIDITEDELDGLLAQAQQKPVADIQQEEQESQQPEDVEDTMLRDFRGNPLPLKTNKKGETVVNWVKLWKDDPEAWARWNDAQERPIVDTKLKLSEGIKDLQKEQEKLQKELGKEILHGMDEDKMDDYQDRLATVANRLDVLTKVLNTYNLPAQAADTFAGEQRRAAAEQTIREQQAGFPGIQQKWNEAPKVVGAADEIRLPNGENITGHYVLTEAYAPTPSHNPADGFKMTDGFPVDENGKTVNDRDYEHDADAQKQVLEKAANYDQRALQTPVIVSADGVVLSGNDRTMASQLAAQSGTDGAYVEYLAKYSQKYGFSAEQVQGFAHPRVVFVPDAEMEYNAATFAKFNAEDKKSQSKTEKAVKAGKTLSPEALGSLATLVDRYEDINALYNDAAGVQELLDTLQAAEVITPEQIAALKDGDKLSGTGMDLLESTLIGSAMDEEAVRIAMSDPSIRKPIVSAIAQIIANNTIEGYTLRTELTDAIILVAKGKGAGEIKTGESVQNFIRQQHLFMDDVVASATVQMLADAINDRRTTQLKKVLSLYNRDAVDAASGQLSLLTQDVPSRDYILRNILEYLGYDTSIIFDTSERESEQRAAAEEAAAADQGGNESQESEAGAPVQSDTGSAVNQFDREEVAAILEQGNVGETGLAEYMSDDEVAEFMRIWDEFLPHNDALGEAYNRLGDDLRATADKARRKAAQAEIDRLEQAQAEAFVPVQDYVDSLLAKYDLFEEPYDRSQDEAEPQEAENETEEEEPETEVEEDIDTPEEPKPDKSKKGGKKSKKGKKASNSGTVFSGDISDETLAAVEYTTDEVEQLIFGASLFGDYTSKKTGEKIEIVYADDEHPVYFDHQIRFWIWQRGAEYGDRHEATATTDYMMRYLKANEFKLTKPSAKKNKYGYWVNSCGVIVNPIRVELPSVHKGWAQQQHAGFAQREDGKWVVTESFHDNNGGYGSPASNERGEGYDTKSDAIRAVIEHGESFLKRFAGAKSKSYEQRDIENLVRTLKTKTLPQALLEEGVVSSVHRAEITASEYDNGEQGLLFGEEELQAEIAEESAKVDTNPTEAQKEAGNYKKGHIKVDGLDISIENPKGSIRRGTDAQGREWQTEMKHSYGYIRRTESVDGDHIDIFLSDTPKRGKVFVVDQVNPETGEFDEHKVMYGFASEDEARAAYLANYEDGWKGLGAITPVTKAEFKKWIDSSNRKTKPFAEYKSVKVADAEEDTQEDVITSPVLEETEGTPGNYHWNDNGVCTNPAIITVPGNDRLGDVCKVSLAENNGTWYVENFVVADGGKGSSWGNRIPSIRNTSISFSSRFAAVKSAISGIRWLLDNPAKKQASAFGETYNGAKELIDFLVTTELDKAKAEDTRIATIIEALKAFDQAKGRGKFGKAFTNLMKSVGEMLGFADDELNGKLKYAAEHFKEEQVSDGLERAKAQYVRRVRKALKDETGNTSMFGYDTDKEQPKETPVVAEKPAVPVYGSQNRVITTDRYQELLKQWKDKMNSLNSGFDPETMMLGLQLGAYHIEAGARQFLVFSTRLIRDIGESIRPYLKSIYNGVRDFPGMEAYKADMDSAAFVDEIDVNTITDTEHVNEPVVEQEETPVPQESTELSEVEEPAWAMHKGEIQGFDGLSSYDVYNACDEYIDRIIGETGPNIAQVDMIAIGSRAFGMAREDSDLDILLEYEGDVKEDEVFNALNAEPLELLGIKVDFFPIRSQESGTLTEWLASHDNGRPVAKEQQPEVSGPVQEETPAPQPSETSGQLGELGKFTHTKTGKEMSIVRLKGDRLSDAEFKQLKARAKEYGGYYSSFKGAGGFLFETEEDAIKFNTINTPTNVSENTDKQTAANTAIISSEAASLAGKAQSIADNAEPADERKANRVITQIDKQLDKIDDQLALLGYYEADADSKFDESYGYSKSAEKKALKDANRLAKKLAADLGLTLPKANVARANIAPAGGEITFELPIDEGHMIYVCIHLAHPYDRENGYSDDLAITQGVNRLDIMFRVEDPKASGFTRYLSENAYAPYNASYAELLKRIRFNAKAYLPEVPVTPAQEVEGPVDLLQVAQEQAEKNRQAGNSKKKSVSSQEEGDAALGGLFADLYEAEEDAEEEPSMPVGLGRKREKPTEVNGFKVGDKVTYTPNQGKRQPVRATIHDFEYDGRPVLDTGLAPVLYEVTEWENVKPLNTENDGLQGNDESSAQGTPAESVQPGGGAQETTGGNGPAEGQEGGRADSGRAGGSESPVRNPRHRYDDSVKRNTRNNRVAKGEVVYPKTPAARYKANIAAICLLKELQDSGKQATKEQMAVLRQYTGWGGLGSYFNNTYSPEYRELKSLLSDEEMQAAAMSGNTAFYTPVEVIDTMWDIAKRLGFEGGNVLEGSAGIGNILASMPKGISEHSAITAVELDSTTGGILELLYPDANVLIRGFEEADIPNGSIDLAITNVPFGSNIQVYDAKEKDLTRKFGGRIHDFCIAKNIRKLAEGGIGIFISTRGTLDNPSKALRSWIVNEGGADIIGAFRLNNKTFEGTGATSDIIIVRKRVGGKVSPSAIDVSSTQITRRETFDTGKTEWNRATRNWEPIMAEGVMEINSYFIEHPENMGGTMGFGFEHKDTFRPGSAALWPDEKIDQQKRLAKWAKQFTAEKEETPIRTQLDPNTTFMEAESAAGATKEGQIILNSKGEVCINRYGKALPLNVNTQKVKGYSKSQVVKDYNELKAAINEVLDYQLKNESDEGLKPLLAKLNRAYDTFSRRYGSLNRNTAISFLRADVDFPAIAAVEDYKEKKGIDGKVKIEVKKTGIFNGRVLGAKRVPTPQTAKDGVIVSINQYGRIDIPFIAQSLGKDEDAVREEILSSGLGFENPLTGGIEVEYEYLSGNVREKLEYAREHNEGGKYDANIKALEKVIPAEIPAHLIEFSLGSDWLPTSLYTEYAKERFGLNDNFVPKNFGGSWSINENVGIDARNEKNRSAGVSSEMLGMIKLGHELMLAAMNKVTVAFSRTYKDDDGHSHTEHDKEASQAAATKIDEMRDDFKEWCRARILGDKDLSDTITKTYNDTFNAIVPKEIRDTFLPEHFEGQVLTMGKEGKPFHLYPHQAKAVIRATTEPLMMAHEVGTGKTFTLISTAMEMRRLGTAKKPMIVVQNATLGQFVSSAKELYPNAKVLTITESDRTAEGRSAFYAKIKYNDWDIIIVPQSVFEMIPDSEERKRAFIQEKIDEKKFILEQAKEAKNQAAQRRLQEELKDLEYERDHDGEKRPKKGRNAGDAKKTAEALANASAKAKKQLDRKVDDVADFDDMGIDALLIDEAHSYKHLGFSTSMQRGVKGVDPSYSKKSAGVYLKTRAVFDKVGWKNVVFATGTPISNTAAEIWTFMKYLMPDDVMRRLHIYYFDDFVSNFGNISQSLEFTTSGKFKENARFASYTNLPELIRIWSSVTDTVLTKEAVAAKAEDGAVEKLDDKVPQMETWTDDKGESHENQVRDIYLPQSPALVDIMTAIRARLEWYEGLTGKEKKENSHVPLVMFGLAKMAAIDPRLVDRSAKDEPLSKTNRVVEETLKALEDSKRYKGTAALFCDNFRRWDTDDSGKRVEGFNIFEEIKRKLVAAGVPEDQIVIMKSGMTTAAKEKIFARVNAGDVRVIMGTTATLGTGVNIQERLFFEGHIDAPNRPMDYTQRMGRILRQGNLHKEWGIPVRVVRFGVEDSLDVTAYQRLSTKSKFINSIMDGKPLLANGMENRVLEEEEEGEFDNPVAVLSGSQYALLKSQAERELRKLRNKKEQHRQDQIYIERALKDNELEIARRKEYIAEDKERLKKLRERYPDGKVTDITIEGVKVKGAEQINAAIKAKVIDPIKGAVEIAKRNPAAGRYSGIPQTKVFKLKLDGAEVFVRAKISAWRDYDEKTNKTSVLSSTEIEYYCPEFGYAGEGWNDYIRVPGGLNAVKDIISDFTSRFASGSEFEDTINRNNARIERLESDNKLMLQRRGQPFADADKLAKQEALVKDYTDKMRKELAEKEAKYAEMAKNAKTSFNLDNVEIEDEDEEEGETHNSDIVEGDPKLNIGDPLVLAEAVRAVNRLAKRLGLRVVFDDTLESKGAYTEGTDFVRINLANCESVDDAIETMLHEGVAHFGLREMLGDEGMKEFINDILSKAAPSIRAKIDAMAAENGWSLEYAAEEYVAELAQKTDYTKAERSLWREILNAVRNLIASITGRDTYITDDVIREMLVASYANLEERSANSADNKLSALTAAVQSMSRFDTDYIPTQKKRREIIENYIEGIRGGDKDVAVVTNEEFLDKASEWGLSEEETNTLNKVIRLVRVAGKTFEDGRIIIFTDNIEDLEQARQVYVHERQHFLTNGYGADFIERVIRSFDGIGGPEYTRLYLKDTVRRIGGTDAYDKYSEIGLAQEFVSFAMQLAYTEENFVDAMKKLYIRPAAIDIIKELDNEQRNESSLSAARRRPADNASDGRRGEDADSNRRGVSGNGYNGASAEDGGIEGQGITHYRVRTKPAPEKTGIGYKVFFRGKDGALYPPMVANPGGEATPVGVWLDADAAPVDGQSKTGRPQVKAGGKGTQGGSGTLAYRPGWHLGEIPYAIQFNRINPETGQRELFPRDFVWAEVEYAADKDYQKDADAEGMTEGGKYRHSYAGLKEVPEDGYYHYRTNPNPETDPWIITGAMKVNRILTDEEVDELVRAAGREPQKRERGVSRNRVAYHGSPADFERFDNEHVGKGEGHQSHGWGTYVSFDNGTAKRYAHLGERDKVTYTGQQPPTYYAGELLEFIKQEISKGNQFEESKQRILDMLNEAEERRKTGNVGSYWLNTTNAKEIEFIEGLEEEYFDVKDVGRNLYTVEVPDDTGDNYIEENKSLYKAIRAKIADALRAMPTEEWKITEDDAVLFHDPTLPQFINKIENTRMDGEKFYSILSKGLGSTKAASKFLSDAGFAGIKYIGGTDGPCAVIFNSDDIKIVGRERWRQGGDYSNPSPVRYKESIGARRLSASETATKFGVGIEFRPSREMRQDGKPLAGRWVDGKIYICLEHCRDKDDAVRTVLHEGVGHQGLRRLIGGDNMREFCLDIFRNAPIAVRSKIAKDAVEKYGGNVVEAVERMAADDVIREVGGEAVFESAEEWIAETSETIDYDNYRRNLWDIIRSALRKALAKVGINIPLSVRDVKWIMVQSAFANHETDALVEARRQVVAKELGFTLRQQAEKGEGIRIERNRRAEESLSSAARLYNKDVLYWWSRLHETWVDKDDAVRRLVSAIEKASGKVAETFEDIRLSLNQQSSKGLAAIEKFEREYYEPMKAAIKFIMGEKGCSLEDVERYVMLKHGLERNEVFAKRDARAYYQDLHDGNVRTIQNSDKIDDITKLQLIAREDKKLKKNLDAIEAGTDAKYLEFRKQDYGGLTAMYSEYDDFAPYDESLESNEEYQARVLQARHPKYTYIDENGREKVDMAATEDAARKEVEAFEHGSEDSTKNLWERINAATKATLKHQYDSNMMSREQYLSVSKMFKYYVPLRGFADNTAEDMYDYYHSDQRNTFTPPLLVAKGRKTEAESPFGYIGAMASSGIAADMKNETKLALYYFVSNRSDNDLVSISEVWYKVTGVDELGRKIFTPVYPPFKEDLSSEEAKQAFRDWEEQMKEEAKAGLAYKGMRKLDLHKSVIHIDDNQKTSHIIRFKVGGKDMMMYINGNPRAAQAINNELNVEMSTDYQKFFGKILRYFSGINTSYNPEFWLSNAQRDALFALMSVSVKEDSAYNEAFRKNFGKILAQTLVPGKKGGAYSLKRKLDNGTLGDTPLENYYREFVENGGVTGYTTLKDNEEWELELRKYTGKDKRAVKAVKTVFGVVQDFGEAIEQMTRFAAYMTSREQGKDIKDSVNDAKELTVNFNRKGSGKTISWQEAGRLRTKSGKKLTPVQKALVVGASWLPAYGRRFIMFFNASTQGLNAMYKLFKKNPGKMGIWTAAYFALGVVQAVIHALLDDDDDYLDIPDYERRNNLLLGGKGVYFKWALPQEARVFYAMGDMVVNHAMGREPHKSILSEVLAAASDIAPLNPSGGLSALAPSALTPVVEVIQNRDYKGAKIYNDMRYLSEEERKRTPAYQKAYQSTGRPYILISQFFNWVSGGDYADAGWININPASVEHILKGATGGAGTTVGKLYRGTIGQFLGEDFSVRNTPFLSRILTVNDDRYRNAHTTELFDYYKAEAEHTKKLINTYRKNGDDDKLDRLYDSEDYEIMLIYNTYKGELQYYNDELKITEDRKERKALMREQDAIRKQMILEISNIGKND